jgi:hypothetical protein
VFIILNIILLFSLLAEICLFTVSWLKPETWVYLTVQAAKVLFVHEEYQKLVSIKNWDMRAILHIFVAPFLAAFVASLVLRGLSFRPREHVGDSEVGVESKNTAKAWT